MGTLGWCGLSLEPFRGLVGAISQAKEVLCLLDFGLSGVRNEGLVGLEKLT